MRRGGGTVLGAPCTRMHACVQGYGNVLQARGLEQHGGDVFVYVTP